MLEHNIYINVFNAYKYVKIIVGFSPLKFWHTLIFMKGGSSREPWFLRNGFWQKLLVE